MLELELVHVDGDVGVVKVLEAAPVVQMQVAHHDGLDVLDAVARLGDGLVQIVLLSDVVDLGEDVARNGLSILTVCQKSISDRGLQNKDGSGYPICLSVFMSRALTPTTSTKYFMVGKCPNSVHRWEFGEMTDLDNYSHSLSQIG